MPFLLRTGKRLAGHRAAGQPDPARAGRARSAGQLPSDGNVLSFSLAGRRRDRPVAGGQEARARRSTSTSRRAAIPLAGLTGADPLPPYVRLIHDVLLGDRSLFTRPDGLAAVWEVAEPLLASPPQVLSYAQGSWGRPRPASWSRRTAGCSASNWARASHSRRSEAHVRARHPYVW